MDARSQGMPQRTGMPTVKSVRWEVACVKLPDCTGLLLITDKVGDRQVRLAAQKRGIAEKIGRTYRGRAERESDASNLWLELASDRFSTTLEEDYVFCMQEYVKVSAAGRRFIVIGGAGFIGSHLVERLLQEKAAAVTVFDNFSSGRKWHLEYGRIQPRLKVVRGEVADLPVLMNAMTGHDTVVHLASNPDIAKAATEPDIDFYQGTLLTQQVLEAMRQCRVQRLWYASGSGVYGERGNTPVA